YTGCHPEIAQTPLLVVGQRDDDGGVTEDALAKEVPVQLLLQPLLLHGPGIQESPWIDNRRLAASPGCSPCKDARVGPQGPGTDDEIDHWYHLAQDGGRRTRKKKGSGRGLRVPHRHPFVADPAVGCHVETVGTVAIRRHDPDVGARLCQGFAETERA